MKQMILNPTKDCSEIYFNILHIRVDISLNFMYETHTRALLRYQIINNHFNRIDSSFVDDLRNFDISCVLSGNFLSCTTDSTTLPGRTMCQVDSQAPFQCKKCELLPLTCTNNTSCVRNNAMQVHMFYTLTKRA